DFGDYSNETVEPTVLDGAHTMKEGACASDAPSSATPVADRDGASAADPASTPEQDASTIARLSAASFERGRRHLLNRQFALLLQVHYTNIPLERLIAVERLARELVEMCNASNALFTPVSQEILKELRQAGEARNELEIVLILAGFSLNPY